MGRLAAVFIVLASCAHSQDIRRVQWYQASSAHFVVYTDDAPDEARRLLTLLERNANALMQLMEFTFAPSSDERERLHVVLFHDQDTFRDLLSAPPNAGGLYKDVDGRAFVMVFQPLHTFVLNHELTHDLVRRVLWNAPVWLNEGLADFYSQIEIEGDEVHFALPSRTIRSDELPPLEKLLQADGEQFYDDRDHVHDNYAAAAMLVHMLNCDRPDDRRRFRQYIAELARGASFGEAWQTAFHDVSLNDLDERLHRYVWRHRFNAFRTRIAPQPPQMTSEHPLSEVDARLLRVRISNWSRPSAKDWIANELAAARALAPNHPEVLYWTGRWELAWGAKQDARRWFEQTTQVQPDHVGAWKALASLELDELEQKPMAERTLGPAFERLKQLAHSAVELNNVAWYLAQCGRANEALLFAARSVQQAAGCWYCRDTMAAVLFQKGAIARAIDEQRTALNVIPEGRADERRQYKQRLDEYLAAAAR